MVIITCEYPTFNFTFFRNNIFFYDHVTLLLFLGWGQLFYNGPKPNVLQKVDNVNVISNSQCQQSYNNKQIVAGQMCTYTQGKDACQGDSGGVQKY